MEQEFCSNHPDRAIVERCEVCGKGLCGYCLYYTQDGQRLCELHAQQAKLNGIEIIPPAIYAQGIIPAQAAAKKEQEIQAFNGLPRKGVLSGVVPLYQANNHDLTAFTAMLMGLFSCAMCFGGQCFLPLIASLLAVMALVNAKDSVDPSRTRQQSIIALATGGVVSAAIVACFLGYFGFYASIFAAIGSGGFGPTYSPPLLPTYTYTPRPTLTPTRSSGSLEDSGVIGVNPALTLPQRPADNGGWLQEIYDAPLSDSTWAERGEYPRLGRQQYQQRLNPTGTNAGGGSGGLVGCSAAF